MTTLRLLPFLAALAIALPAGAQSLVNNVEVKRGAKVDLVFYTADDCRYCEQWKRAAKDDTLKWAEKSRFTYHEVGKRRVADAYQASHFPASAGFAWQQMQAEQRYKFMIPRWAVFADGHKVIEGAGTGDWGRMSRFLNEVLEARDAGK